MREGKKETIISEVKVFVENGKQKINNSVYYYYCYYYYYK